jgi:hypothetical protein
MSSLNKVKVESASSRLPGARRKIVDRAMVIASLRSAKMWTDLLASLPAEAVRETATTSQSRAVSRLMTEGPMKPVAPKSIARMDYLQAKRRHNHSASLLMPV